MDPYESVPKHFYAFPSKPFSPREGAKNIDATCWRWPSPWWLCSNLHPKDREGNVFTGVSLSTGGKGYPRTGQGYFHPAPDSTGEYPHPTLPHPTPRQDRGCPQIGWGYPCPPPLPRKVRIAILFAVSATKQWQHGHIPAKIKFRVFPEFSLCYKFFPCFFFP